MAGLFPLLSRPGIQPRASAWISLENGNGSPRRLLPSSSLTLISTGRGGPIDGIFSRVTVPRGDALSIAGVKAIVKMASSFLCQFGIGYVMRLVRVNSAVLDVRLCITF